MRLLSGLTTGIVICGVLLAGASAQAGSISIVNAGFEDPLLSAGDFTNNSVPGWTIVGTANYGAGVYYPNGGITAQEGNNIAYLGAFGQPANSITQVLTTALAANTTYTLAVDVGRRESVFRGYASQLFADGVLLAEDRDSQTPAQGGWITSTLVFTTGASHAQLGEFLELRFLSSSSTGQTNFDDVRLTSTTAVVPLPAAGWMGLGLLALFGAARRFRGRR